MPDSTPPAESYDLTANEAALNGVTKYWTTFYHPFANYKLPAGAMALTMNSNKQLYVVGNGDVIPANCAVIIMSEASSITLTKLDTTTVTKPADSILVGTITETAVSSLNLGTKKVYVLSEDAFHGIGFFEFTGTIPANKAYIYEE